MKDYKELLIWQRSMELTKSVYKLIRKLPPEERFALADQMRRAAISVPSNIAEGYARGNDKELNHFLRIALGSLAEIETQIYLSMELEYLNNNDTDTVLKLSNEVGKMLNAFIKKISF